MIDDKGKHAIRLRSACFQYSENELQKDGKDN